MPYRKSVIGMSWIYACSIVKMHVERPFCWILRWLELLPYFPNGFSVHDDETNVYFICATMFAAASLTK